MKNIEKYFPILLTLLVIASKIKCWDMPYIMYGVIGSLIKLEIGGDKL